MSETETQVCGPLVVSRPKVPLPEGAWDCHAHCFGPFDVFPLPAGSAARPTEAHGTQYLQMLDHVGLARGVLVHGSAYGFDMACTLDGVAQAQGRVAGIGVVPSDIAPDALAALRARGMVGLRFSHGKSPGPGVLPLDALPELAGPLADLGMQAHVWADAADCLDRAAMFRDAACPVVFDHMGMPPRGAGPQDSVVRGFIDMAEETGAWIKLIPHRFSDDWPLARDVRALHEALCERLPDRLVWGSDWPFLGMQALAPDVGQRLDLLRDWTSDAALFTQILVGNPRRLFNDLSATEDDR